MERDGREKGRRPHRQGDRRAHGRPHLVRERLDNGLPVGRIISPAEQSDEVLDLLRRCPSTTSVVAYRGAAVDPAGDVISCDVAEEDASYLVSDLRAMRIHERGSVDLERIDATVSVAADEAERRTPGASADAVLWENVGAKIADGGFISWGLVALFALYRQKLTGRWRTIYVVNVLIALYLNVLVLIAQSFQKVSFLKAYAPTGGEPSFLIAQVVTLIAFALLGWMALKKYHPLRLIM